jgi:exonuclease 3'-5' domain-containing protein 1
MSSKNADAIVSTLAISDDSGITALVESMQKSKLDGNCIIVDSTPALIAVLDQLINLPTMPPSLYVDLEGVNLSREGSVSIFQLFISPKRQTYLFDVHILGDLVFSTPSTKGVTLKRILESEAIPKVFFDVRNDSDALFSHYAVSLCGVYDLQLMELASRRGSKTYVNGLARCIEHDASMSVEEKRVWKATKEEGVKLFAPERGGSYEVFNVRPLADIIQRYCTQDVQYLPGLWSLYKHKLSERWMRKVEVATIERIRTSQTATYNGNGPGKAYGPW